MLDKTQEMYYTNIMRAIEENAKAHTRQLNEISDKLNSLEFQVSGQKDAVGSFKREIDADIMRLRSLIRRS